MASRSADFNYKVALASGLKSLQAGRLRQAEEQFRYLVKNFAGAEGGYRGLAKVLVEQEDRPAALRMLLDGGAALAKADRRENAIALYREAVQLDPNDLAAHRRLAAALTLAGNQDDAAREYVRYINNAMSAGDESRAKAAAEYALGRMPGNAQIAEAARATGAEIPAYVAPSSQERDAHMRATSASAPSPQPDAQAPAAANASRAAATPQITLPPTQRWDGPIPVEPTPRERSPWDLPPPPVAKTTWVHKAPENGDPWKSEDEPAPAPEEPPHAEISPDDDAMTVEAAAARFMESGDARGAEHALEAARRYIADGRIDAASDLLLQMVAKGVSGHEAQRLLVDVTKNLGRSEVAKAKARLLIEMLKLDGKADLAAEVEQLSESF